MPVRSVIKGLLLIENGAFDSFDAVVEAAIDILTNELAHGRGLQHHDKPAKPHAGEGAPVDLTTSYIASPRHPDLMTASVPTVDPIPKEKMASNILLFTVPRILPVKIVVRELLSEILREGGPHVDFGAFHRIMASRGLLWREELGRLDRRAGRGRGKRLWTAFPSGDRDLSRSVDRFFGAYVSHIYDDGRVDGAALVFGFASLAGSREEPEIGITDAGVRFARMENPVLDARNNVSPPFSREEVDFLLKHTSERLPMEAEHMGFYLEVLKERGGVDRDTVNRQMRRFYERIWNPLSLSRELVDSVRTAVHGRCQELGLVTTVRRGRRVIYQATNAGLEWIPFLLGADEVRTEVVR